MGGIKSTHGVLQSYPSGVEARAGLRDVHVAKHVRHVVERPTCFEKTAAGSVTKIVEGQIDCPERFTALF
jgi:hypothetical protein